LTVPSSWIPGQARDDKGILANPSLEIASSALRAILAMTAFRYDRDAIPGDEWRAFQNRRNSAHRHCEALHAEAI